MEKKGWGRIPDIGTRCRNWPLRPRWQLKTVLNLEFQCLEDANTIRVKQQSPKKDMNPGDSTN